MADVADVRPPSWGVVAVCVALACWLAVASAATSAPRRVVPRRRPRYQGVHAEGRVIA